MSASRRTLLTAAMGLTVAHSGLVTATQEKAEPSKEKASAKKPVVVLETNMGSITLELNAEKAPITVKNFLAYVERGHFNGTIFHRVIPDFMIQGGGFDREMEEKPTEAPIKNEAGNGLKNERGTIAMARTGVVDSATAQFFINVKDNEFLNHRQPTPEAFGYCVFGKVTKGLDVVDKIRVLPTGIFGVHQNVPREPVVIKSATLQK